MLRSVGIDIDVATWDTALTVALTGEGIRSVYQPIIGVERGEVIGYEALTRFDSAVEATPDRWFAEAHTRGLGNQLEAMALRCALRAREDLPRSCFLSVNVGPSALYSEDVDHVLAEQAHLRGLVLEITEHEQIDSYDRLRETLDRHRRRGASVAVDDAGSGYSGLDHILQIRPAMLKLDRLLISDIDTDPIKRSIVEMLTTLAQRIGAWLLAEGVETPAELHQLRELGVPMAQGFFFAMPSQPWSGLRIEVVSEYRDNPIAENDDTIHCVTEQAPWVEASNLALPTLDSNEPLVVIDEDGRPVRMVDPANPSGPGRLAVITAGSTLIEAANRALARPRAKRFVPVLVVDGMGRYVGVIHIDRLLDALARRTA